MKKFFAIMFTLLLLPIGAFLTACKTKLETIVLVTEDVKLEYIVGEELSLNGLRVEARYSNGDIKDAKEYQVDSSSVDKDTAGEYTIKVTYSGITKEFKVNYYEKGTIHIVNNKKFYIGQTFEDALPELVYTSGKGEQIPITYYTLVEFDNDEDAEPGKKIAKIQYSNGYVYDVEVEVLSNEDYVNYILEEAAKNQETKGVNCFKATDGESGYVLFVSEQSTYYKIGNKEVWIGFDGKMTTRQGETVQTEQGGSYGNTVKSKVQADFAGVSVPTFNFPLASFYGDCLEQVSGMCTQSDGGEKTFAFSMEYTTLTVTMTIAGQGTFTFDVDLTTYTLKNFKVSLGEQVLELTLNQIYDYPAVPTAPAEE